MKAPAQELKKRLEKNEALQMLTHKDSQSLLSFLVNGLYNSLFLSCSLLLFLIKMGLLQNHSYENELVRFIGNIAQTRQANWRFHLFDDETGTDVFGKVLYQATHV